MAIPLQTALVRLHTKHCDIMVNMDMEIYEARNYHHAGAIAVYYLLSLFFIIERVKEGTTLHIDIPFLKLSYTRMEYISSNVSVHVLY